MIIGASSSAGSFSTLMNSFAPKRPITNIMKAVTSMASMKP